MLLNQVVFNKQWLLTSVLQYLISFKDLLLSLSVICSHETLNSFEVHVLAVSQAHLIILFAEFCIL